MFCTYAGTKKDVFRGEPLGITSNNKKSKSGPKRDSVSVFYFSLERLQFDFSTLTIMYYRDKHFAIDNVLQITHDSVFFEMGRIYSGLGLIIFHKMSAN